MMIFVVGPPISQLATSAVAAGSFARLSSEKKRPGPIVAGAKFLRE